MPVDASIALGVKPPQFESPLNQLAKVLQVRGIQQDQQLGQMKMDEYQRSVADQNALRNALSQPGSDPYNVLLQHGKTGDALAWQKGQGDAKKTGAETEKLQLANQMQKLGLAAQLLSTVRDQASYDEAKATAKANGLDTSRMPPQFDPAFIQSRLQESQTIQQQLDQVWKQKGYDLDVRKADETGRHNRSTEGLTARGQNISAETSRRGQDLVNQRAQEANSAGKVPAGYRQKGDGTLEFIPGGPADPNAAKKAAPTEFQGKAGMFGNRAQEADRIITSLEGKYSPSGINTKQAVGTTPLIGGGLEAGANMMLGDASQKAEQAQRDFVNAVLRLESGAAIGQSEFDNARKQYFRQPGDSAAVVQQKAQNRKTAIQGLMSNARPGAEAAAPSATRAPNIDSLLDKYK